MGSTGPLHKQIWTNLYASRLGGYSTIKRVALYFFWPSLSKDIKSWNAECLICQANKIEFVSAPGLLQPLSVQFKP